MRHTRPSMKSSKVPSAAASSRIARRRRASATAHDRTAQASCLVAYSAAEAIV